MDFRLLQMRLVSHVRARVRNGEISERSLARLTGISQPHIHNVLKGARLLSADLADQILHRLRIDLVDLLTADEGGGAHGVPPGQEPADPGECRMVALLDGWIGRECPYPQAAGRERYPFPAADVERLESPVAARLAPDPLRTPIFAGRGVVLLDRSERVRLGPDKEGYFALDLSGGGTIGLVRRAGRHLYLWVCLADAWQSVPLPDRDPLDVIQGRVSLVVRNL
jgi:transcriptional regulator with XRE-family HTH domain